MPSEEFKGGKQNSCSWLLKIKYCLFLSTLLINESTSSRAGDV